MTALPLPRLPGRWPLEPPAHPTTAPGTVATVGAVLVALGGALRWDTLHSFVSGLPEIRSSATGLSRYEHHWGWLLVALGVALLAPSLALALGVLRDPLVALGGAIGGGVGLVAGGALLATLDRSLVASFNRHCFSTYHTLCSDRIDIGPGLPVSIVGAVLVVGGAGVALRRLRAASGRDTMGSAGTRASPRVGRSLPGDTKVCPDCAETVKAAARVCRYCQHVFADGHRE